MAELSKEEREEVFEAINTIRDGLTDGYTLLTSSPHSMTLSDDLAEILETASSDLSSLLSKMEDKA